MIAGDATIDGTRLKKRDGLGVWDTETIAITTHSQDTHVLLLEVPMSG